VQRFKDFQRVQYAAHAHVVGYAAVDKMKVGSLSAVAVGL